MFGYKKTIRKLLIQVLITATISFFAIFSLSYLINGKDSIEFETIIMFTIIVTVLLSFMSEKTQVVISGKAFDTKRKESENINLNITKDSIIYFREIPKEYSPAIASILLDLSVEYEKDILATVLDLIHKGYLKKDNKRIILTSKHDIGELLPHERLIVDNISKKKFDIIKWKKQVIKDSMDKGFIKKGYNRIGLKKITGILFLMILILFLFIESDYYIFNIIKLLSGIVILPYIIYLISYFASEKEYEFTEKGNIEHEKIKKLKAYIEDFSFLNEAGEDKIIIWEGFLIYSISLGVNKKIYSDEKIVNILSNTSSSISVDDFENISKVNEYMLLNFR